MADNTPRATHRAHASPPLELTCRLGVVLLEPLVRTPPSPRHARDHRHAHSNPRAAPSRNTERVRAIDPERVQPSPRAHVQARGSTSRALGAHSSQSSSCSRARHAQSNPRAAPSCSAPRASQSACKSSPSSSSSRAHSGQYSCSSSRAGWGQYSSCNECPGRAQSIIPMTCFSCATARARNSPKLCQEMF